MTSASPARIASAVRACGASESPSGSSSISSDGVPCGAEALEVGVLVLEPLAEDQLRLLVLDLGPLDLPARVRERERRQVLAGEEGRDVGRREVEAVVVKAHRLGSINRDSCPTYAFRGQPSAAPYCAVRRLNVAECRSSTSPLGRCPIGNELHRACSLLSLTPWSHCRSPKHRRASLDPRAGSSLP